MPHEVTSFLLSGLLLVLAWLLRTALDLSFRVARLESHSSVRPVKSKRGYRVGLAVAAVALGFLAATWAPAVAAFARTLKTP